MMSWENFVFDHWFWFVGALVLLGLEILVPGVVFLWLAIAGGVTGIIVLIFSDLSWEWQVVLFSLLSIVSVFAGRSYLRKHPLVTSDSTLNRRGAQYVGRRYTLVTDMDNGEGKIKIGDTLWKVRGDFDGRTGDRIRVTGTDGVVLMVERGPD